MSGAHISSLVSSMMTVLTSVLTNYLPLTLVIPTITFLQTSINMFLDSELCKTIMNYFKHELNIKHEEQHVIIRQYDEKTYENVMYEKLQTYLTDKFRETMNSLDVYAAGDEIKFRESFPVDKSIFKDSFNGIDYIISHEPELQNELPRMGGSSESSKKYFKYVVTSSTKNINDVKSYLSGIYLQRAKTFTTKIYQIGSGSGNWNTTNQKINRTFANTFLTQKVYDGLVKDIKKFIENKDVYDKLGLLHKRGFILYGPPGTGKTSIIKALANTFSLPIYKLDFSNIYDNSSLTTYMEGINRYQLGKPHIVCIEDFERSNIFKTLTDDNDTDTDTNNQKGNNANYSSDDDIGESPWIDPDEATKPKKGKKKIHKGVTPDGILNAIDGVIEIPGQILIITTNDLQAVENMKVDGMNFSEAFIRPGRIDKKIEITYVDNYQFNKIIEFFYGINDHGINVDGLKMTQAKLYNYINMFPQDYEGFINSFKIDNVKDWEMH